MTTTFRNRGLSVAAGVLAFAAAHALEVAMWAAWFGGAHDPWFLNSSTAAAFTLATTFGLSLVAGALGSSGPFVALGGVAAMTTVLFLMPGGPGTIFPIVLVIGAAFVGGSCLLGAWIGKEAAALFRSRRDS